MTKNTPINGPFAADQLRSLYSYDSSTGVFTRLIDFSNGLKAGSVAGHITRANRVPYKVIKINKRLYLCHRLAWLFVTGDWPKGLIDHINGDGLDNRFANLRVVTNAQNLQASLKIPKHNTSGFKGASFNSVTGKWVAGISINNKRKYIGSFDCPEAAHKAYMAFKREAHFQ